jgi:hypothetical protein
MCEMHVCYVYFSYYGLFLYVIRIMHVVHISLAQQLFQIWIFFELMTNKE